MSGDVEVPMSIKTDYDFAYISHPRDVEGILSPVQRMYYDCADERIVLECVTDEAYMGTDDDGRLHVRIRLPKSLSAELHKRLKGGA